MLTCISRNIILTVLVELSEQGGSIHVLNLVYDCVRLSSSRGYTTASDLTLRLIHISEDWFTRNDENFRTDKRHIYVNTNISKFKSKVNIRRQSWSRITSWFRQFMSKSDLKFQKIRDGIKGGLSIRKTSSIYLNRRCCRLWFSPS
jgi:hypothetical protein